MATQITNYQCPACTGPLHYVGTSDRLECDYCGSSFSTEEIEALYGGKEAEAAQAFQQAEQQTSQAEDADEGSVEWDTSGLNDDWGEDAAGMRAYNCPSCSAELICDENTAATSCPYCGNPTVIPGQFSGALKPDYIVPFMLEKEDAVRTLKQHYKGKRFLPKAFTDENHIREIQGVYVPFWLFDGKASGSTSYAATRIRVHRRGDVEITTTSHFTVHRAGSMEFIKVPVDASSKMPDDYMDSIEPYDYSKLTEFSTAYLPGFLADKYDVSVEMSRERVDNRFAGTLERALNNTVIGYTTCIPTGKNITLKRGKVHYALLPVWLLSTKWNGKDFLFAINGQTGKLAGDLPISWKRAFGTFAKLTAILTAVGTVLLTMLS